MPYSVPFVKINATGHFGGSTTDIVEKWSAGLHLTKNGGVIGGTSELTSFLTTWTGLLKTFHGTLGVQAGTSCWLSEVNGAYIGTDGKYALGALQTTTRVPVSPITAGQISTVAPWATAMAISLRSLLTRGPASHGRSYWPWTGIALTSATGRITSAQQTTYATAFKTLLDGTNSAAAAVFGAGTNVGLVSNRGDGFQSPVVRFGIGAKPDHMESRERDLPEAYVFQTPVLAATLMQELDDRFRDRIRDEFPDATLP